ncbi:MAG: hypothetical protein HKN22_02015, partial [Bacteroidia bacterium]|nr:hypothetical protein [Bacteroidia bacterium]
MKGYSQTNKDIHIEYISFDVDFAIDKWPSVLKSVKNSRSEFDILMRKMNDNGYFEVSIDSVYGDKGNLHAIVYVGSKYFLGRLISQTIPNEVFKKYFDDGGMDWGDFTDAKIEVRQYFQDSGYFNSQVYLDEITIEDNIVNASVEVDRGYL